MRSLCLATHESKAITTSHEFFAAWIHAAATIIVEAEGYHQSPTVRRDILVGEERPKTMQDTRSTRQNEALGSISFDTPMDPKKESVRNLPFEEDGAVVSPAGILASHRASKKEDCFLEHPTTSLFGSVRMMGASKDAHHGAIPARTAASKSPECPRRGFAPVISCMGM